jgi:hypothetical protein
MTQEKDDDDGLNPINCSSALTESHWLQIEQAASGCISGTSDEWPELRDAIERLTSERMTRRGADWLQGFCSGAMLMRNNGVWMHERLRRLHYVMVALAVDMHEHVGTEEAKEHAKELAGAANLVWQWSDHV